MRSKSDWIAGLKKMKRNVYLHGGKVDRDDEMMAGAVNTIGTTFDFAAKPEHADLMTAKSHLTGETINRF
ncbi:MAG: aromatic ring hydroxylase, partial [Proteobacteria bacterium]|nr:aromatic ring hydroxylase [Pseudomonadota bacterium]